ncbi:MAG: DUF4340 domain-containing protein [Blautia sp.]|nr:DUF4340 domain-containing protein [Blautia sp.]
MNKFVRLVIAACVMALLFGGWHYLRKKNEDAARWEEEKAKGEILVEVDPEMVQSLSFSINGTETIFVKTDQIWTMQQDAFFPVDEAGVEKILSTLHPLRVSRVLPEPEDLASYGLDLPVNTVRIEQTDGSEVKVQLGDKNEGTGDVYVKVDQDDTVYTVSPALLESLPADQMDIARSDSLTDISEYEAQAIEIQTGEKMIRLLHDSSSWTVAEGFEEEGKAADEEAVKALLNELNSLYMGDFVEYYCTTPEKYGLDDPLSSIYVYSQEEMYSYGLLIGNPTADENSVYVQLEGSMQVHTLTKTAVDEILSHTAEEFLKK